jgi:hypothetical protein
LVHADGEANLIETEMQLPQGDVDADVGDMDEFMEEVAEDQLGEDNPDQL